MQNHSNVQDRTKNIFSVFYLPLSMVKAWKWYFTMLLINSSACDTQCTKVTSHLFKQFQRPFLDARILQLLRLCVTSNTLYPWTSEDQCRSESKSLTPLTKTAFPYPSVGSNDVSLSCLCTKVLLSAMSSWQHLAQVECLWRKANRMMTGAEAGGGDSFSLTFTARRQNVSLSGP